MEESGDPLEDIRLGMKGQLELSRDREGIPRETLHSWPERGQVSSRGLRTSDGGWGH